jgi:hypothetical protein
MDARGPDQRQDGVLRQCEPRRQCAAGDTRFIPAHEQWDLFGAQPGGGRVRGTRRRLGVRASVLAAVDESSTTPEEFDRIARVSEEQVFDEPIDLERDYDFLSDGVRSTTGR